MPCHGRFRRKWCTRSTWPEVLDLIHRFADTKARERAPHRRWSIASSLDLCPPKAEVTGSNPVGRANKINDLRNSFRRRAKGKLTINSPTERAHLRAIGGNLARLVRLTRPARPRGRGER